MSLWSKLSGQDRRDADWLYMQEQRIRAVEYDRERAAIASAAAADAERAGFHRIDNRNPIPPFACESCGAVVAVEFFETHVGVCPGRVRA